MVGLAAVHLLPGAARGADGRARDDRRPHQEHRARRDEGVRHQPVSSRRSAADSRDDRQRHSCLASKKACSPASNRRADAINNAIRGRLPTTTDLNRRWVAANNGDIYQYLYFEPGRNRLNGLSIYEFGKDPSTLARRTYFSYATFNGDREAKGQVSGRAARDGSASSSRRCASRRSRTSPSSMEGPGYFASERLTRSTCHTGSSAST